MTVRADDLAHRVRSALADDAPEGPAVVAVSGGLDSSVLLHVARFGLSGTGREWIAAHFDHRMRESSLDDARWVTGLCRAWQVPLEVGSADRRLGSEAAAREARYVFLERVRVRTGASRVLTAHHADDQAETVLFRLLRGTGGKGLEGIPPRRSPAIVRPLLDVWREEVEAYALEHRVGWRCDPTNADPAYARNAIRHRLLPDAERLVAPGARRALVRLAALAGEEEAAWDSALPHVLRALAVEEGEAGVSLLRRPLTELHPAVQARVLRALATELGSTLDHRTTRRAVEFAASGVSGRAIQLGGPLSLGIDLDRLVLGRPRARGVEEPLSIRDPGPGRGVVVLGGTAVPVAWGGREVDARRTSGRFDAAVLAFPLSMRSRRPGDRIVVTAGTKKVKKLMLEHRIPPSERHRLPLLVDAEGRVLWIPGVARSELAPEPGPATGLRIGVG